MKCPDCNGNHQFKNGMRCTACGYSFVLSPKEVPYITDYTVKKAIERLSLGGHQYFTQRQLLYQLFLILAKKSRRQWLIFYISIMIIATIATGATSGVSSYLIACPIFIGIFFIYRAYKGNFKTAYLTLNKVIETYNKAKPIQEMVYGNLYNNLDEPGFKAEIMDFAPEKILIVEHDDLVDMLVLNRFHFDNKVLIISSNKYPQRAFEIYTNTIEKFPETPILILHDASEAGFKMKSRLLKEKAWQFQDKSITDLGLMLPDLKRLKFAMWVPSIQRGDRKNLNIVSHNKNPAKIIKNGYTMPVDIAPPKNMLNVLGLAAAAGLPMLSYGLYESQKKFGNGSYEFSGGYG